MTGTRAHRPVDDEIELAAATLDQARFWARVYNEIMVMETDVLARVEELIAAQTPEARGEAETSTLLVIVAQLSRFQRRRASWQARVKELQQAEA